MWSYKKTKPHTHKGEEAQTAERTGNLKSTVCDHGFVK